MRVIFSSITSYCFIWMEKQFLFETLVFNFHWNSSQITEHLVRKIDNNQRRIRKHQSYLLLHHRQEQQQKWNISWQFADDLISSTSYITRERSPKKNSSGFAFLVFLLRRFAIHATAKEFKICNHILWVDDKRRESNILKFLAIL